MSESIIQANHLSKKYLLSETRAPYKTLRETVTQAVKAPFNQVNRWLRPRNSLPEGKDVFWALDDISFDIKQGEVIGIIGSNGAGKSTLLKIISRITEPTGGSVDVVGRVGSLLEVGTGFHPELTGRENVFLSGAILGMNRREIQRKMDTIVAFAEIEKHLDTAVKHYSSGMYLRLAFAVAAHLEPNILLVDEVLAVGDLAFQQKCLNHMRNLTGTGMTILMVSHNMAAIQSSCERAILLDHGKMIAEGDPLSVIHQYRQQLQNGKNVQGRSILAEQGREELVTIKNFEIFAPDGASRREIAFDQPSRIRIELHAKQRIDFPFINFGLVRGDGVPVCNFNNWYDNFRIDYIEGDCALEGWLPPTRLVPDFYEVHVLVWPWGGGHLDGDMTRSQPYAWSTFGDLKIEGPGLNAHDGVFQIPALGWQFERNGVVTKYDTINGENIYQAFEKAPEDVSRFLPEASRPGK
jgi:lipopolysaccharide transport system ATP-binding protein